MKLDVLLTRLAASPSGGAVGVITRSLVCLAPLVVLRLLLMPLMAPASGMTLFVPAVLVASLWAGWRAGLLSALLAVIASTGIYMLGRPLAEFDLDRYALSIVLFGLNVAFAGPFGVYLRTAFRRLAEAREIESQQQAKLQESEARFRTFAENAPVMLWMGDPQGGCVHLNRALRAFWGTGEDLSEFDWGATVHPEDRERLWAVVGPATARGEPFEAEARYRRADGSWRLMTTHAQPRYAADGTYEGMTGVNVDVTDAREAEAALRESEARFRTMADSAPAPIWMTDTDSGLIFGNRALIEMLGGETAQSVLGRAWAERVHPDDFPAVWAAREAAHPKRLPYGWDARFRNARGDWVWIRATTSPRLDEQGNFLGYVGIGFDITTAREAEAALRESEQRFREIADSAPAPVWVSGPDGGIEFGNRAMIDFFGGEPEKVLGMGWIERVHAEDLPGALAAREVGRAEGAPFNFEARFLDGQDRWRAMQVATTPRLDAKGRLIGYVGMAFDVTEARAATDAVRASEQRFRDVADNIPNLAWMAEPDGWIYWYNQRWFDYTGATLEQMQGWGWKSVHHPDHVEAVETQFRESLESGQSFEMSFPLRSAAGEWRWFLTRAEPIRDESGRVVRWFGTNTDITDLREAEAELKESEARFRSIADMAPVLIWVTRADRKRAFVNRAYVEFMGSDYETALKADWREALHPEDIDRVISESLAGEASGEPFMLEARYRRHDGLYRWVRSYSRPRFDADGQLLGFVGVAYDVTDARKAQDDLININELLEARVAEALAEKDRAEAALMHAQRMEAVGRLTGGVAHDFNNLLTVVIGALDMVSRSAEDVERRDRLIQAALAAARRGERLTHQLLAFSRRQALRPQVSDLNRVISEGEPLLRRAVGEAVRLEVSLEPGLAPVNIDPAHFEAALLNLIVNARDAVEDGGRIEVSAQSARLAAGEREGAGEGDYVLIQVRDDGAGMPPEVRERVFEPFFTTKAVGKGTGLGLSQVYGFMRQSGGSVEIDSAPGEGTTVSLWLPAVADAVAEAPERPATALDADHRPFEGVRVLLAEDEADVASVCGEMLATFGMKVTRAADAAQALQALNFPGAEFDLLMTDLIMPGGMNGVELARQATDRRPGLRVLLASGYAGEAVERALADAPWPLLPKPYDAEALRRALAEALSRTA